MKVFLALSLLACSTFCGAATLTINNLRSEERRVGKECPV